MKKRAVSAFTLIEMLTVMAIIAVIASLVMAANSLVNQKAARARAEGEIQAISAASESYKADNGIYPTHSDSSEAFKGESGVTDNIDPRKDKNPMDKKYQLSSLYLYSQLSGDLTGSNGPDGKVDADAKVYFPFKPEMLGTEKNKTTNKIEKVLYLQDPFGQSYGYSTAAATAEAEYQRELRKTPGAKRGDNPKGYNSAGFDLWSTGGTAAKSSGSGKSAEELEQARWVKNW